MFSSSDWRKYGSPAHRCRNMAHSLASGRRAVWASTSRARSASDLRGVAPFFPEGLRSSACTTALPALHSSPAILFQTQKGAKTNSGVRVEGQDSTVRLRVHPSLSLYPPAPSHEVVQAFLPVQSPLGRGKYVISAGAGVGQQLPWRRVMALRSRWGCGGRERALERPPPCSRRGQRSRPGFRGASGERGWGGRR